jgi:hypothetical protein
MIETERDSLETPPADPMLSDPDSIRGRLSVLRVAHGDAAGTARATATKRDRATRRIRRAAELQNLGRTRREIGEIMAAEEHRTEPGTGEPSPFSAETVKGWLRLARRG